MEQSESENDEEWTFVDDGKGGYAVVVRGEECPEVLAQIGYTEIPKSHIIPLLPEQAHHLAFLPQIPQQVPIERQIAFKHFTALGWILRDGATYGVDYLLYGGPPGKVHSQYGVLVSNVEKGEVLKWRYLAGIARTVYNAKKELLIVRTNQTQVLCIYKVDRFLPELLNKKK